MRIVKWAAHAAAAATLALLPATTSAQTLKVVMHADVKIIGTYAPGPVGAKGLKTGVKPQDLK